jgi:hypothetical protein
MRVCRCLMKVININKYKQNHNDVTYNIKEELEIDVLSSSICTLQVVVYFQIVNSSIAT